MNKEELIAILKKRSQESYSYVKEESPVDGDDQALNEEHDKYISKIKIRREEDKKRVGYIIVIGVLMTLVLFLYFNSSSTINSINKNDLTFNDLPTKIKDLYVSKIEIEKTINDTKINQQNKILDLEKEIITLKKNIADLENGTAALSLDAILNKSKRYEATGCYIMEAGKHDIYDSCKKKIDDFLTEIKNYDAKSYEVIAVMDGTDRNFATSVLSIIPNEKFNNSQLKDTLLEGIARNRTLEATNYLKKMLGKEIIITYVPYIAYTADKRGFTIRAYK